MRQQHVSTREGYSHWAQDYDEYRNPLIAAEEPVVRALLGDLRNCRVLDAGCGTGRHAGWMASQGASVVGIDTSEEMLARARQKHPHLDLRCGSVLDLELDSAGFDVVLNALSAEHFADLGALLTALSRPMASGGAMVLSVWHPFMVLKGVLTHYEDARTGTEFVLPTYPHLVSDYLRELRRLELKIDDLQEPRADEDLIARMPHLRKHAGMPLALVFRASRRSA
jgi:2-polyprenyl-3-methyl-5-hydroxy-6-metoxy-1,4-benzoquinol methylase